MLLPWLLFQLSSRLHQRMLDHETMNPDSPSAAYGYAGMGPYQGGQAEFVLVPSADFNYLKLGV